MQLIVSGVANARGYVRQSIEDAGKSLSAVKPEL